MYFAIYFEKILNTLLNQLNLIENNAVLFRNKEDGATFDDFSVDINKKLDSIKPDAFFVFNKQPLVLFFDLTSENYVTVTTLLLTIKTLN